MADEQRVVDTENRLLLRFGSAVTTSSNATVARPSIDTALRGAILMNNVAEVRRIVRSHPVSELNRGGRDALRTAAELGHLVIVRFLVEEAGIAAGGPDAAIFSLTPMLAAVSSGQLDVVKYLLKVGASLEERGTSGFSAPVLAAKAGHLHVLRWLLEEEGAECDHANAYSFTPLLAAASSNESAVCEWLLRDGRFASVVERDAVGITALLMAAARSNTRLVRFLLEEGGASVHEQDKDHMTVLHHLAHHRSMPLLEYLVTTAKANVGARTLLGQTPLMFAVQNDSPEAAQLLLASGAPVDDSDIAGDTALHFAARYDDCAMEEVD